MSSKDRKKDFLALYNNFSDSIFRYCFYKVSDRERSLEIMQDVFVKTWEFIQKGGEIDNGKAFLFKTANNLVIDWYRKKKSVSLDDIQEQGIEIEDETETNTIDKLDAKAAMEKVQGLEEKYKEVLLLRFVENLSVKEIAAMLDEKENNISVRIHRAIEKLQKEYNV